MINKSTNINQNLIFFKKIISHLNSLNAKKTPQHIRWKSKSWLGTGLKVVAGLT
jgi:hypothetical protein